MNDYNSPTTSSGWDCIGIVGPLLVVFITLKFLEVDPFAGWSWLAVIFLSFAISISISLALFVIVIAFGILFGGAAAAGKGLSDWKNRRDAEKFRKWSE